MLKWVDLMGEAHDRVQTAIDRLRNFEPPEGYHLAFSGGKDSQCIYHLAKQAGVKFDAHYAVTSVDPPELVRFIKQQYPDVHFDIPHDKNGKPVTMWSLIASHMMPPTRIMRYCCAQLKETAGQGRLVVTGVRWSESARRKKERHLIDSGKKEGQYTNYDNEDTRKMVEQCYIKRRTTLNPIIDWSEKDVWEYLNDVAKVPHCELYDHGFTRLGCIGCPMKSPKAMLADFERWPKYRENYLRAFVPMLENAKKHGTRWETVDDVMRWWIERDNNVKIDENQMEIEEEYDE